MAAIVESRFAALAARLNRVDRRLGVMIWMCAANVTLTLLALVLAR